MKNKNNAIVNLGRIVLILCLLVTIGCKDDAWDEHYEQHDSRLDSNILAVLSADPDYSTFVKYIKQTGYSSQLEAAQSYTVWAPNNAAFSQVSTDIINNPDLLKALIGNHISLFSYNTSNNEETFVKMFNNKYVDFINTSGDSSFGDVKVINADILASNGIVHNIDEVLLVNPNIWGYLNENETKFPLLVDYLNQFNETGFDEANSTKTGSNSLGQPVYDSIFSTTNTYFKTIGDLSSEESRFTFIGLTDDVYNQVYDDISGYYNYPFPDSIKLNTDRTIFKNLNFPLVDIEDLNGEAITTTTGSDVVIDVNSVLENISVSNGNLFVLDQLNFNPKDVIYKPIRYEIENTERRTVGSLTDFAIQKKYDAFASGKFTNVVSLLENPVGDDENNYFEISFRNVLAASYNIKLKFSPVGASQGTKLRFEFFYIAANFKSVVVKIGPVEVSNLEDGEITIGDVIDFTHFINNEDNNYFRAKLKVIVDVSEVELLVKDRTFGIDYAELVPVE